VESENNGDINEIDSGNQENQEDNMEIDLIISNKKRKVINTGKTTESATISEVVSAIDSQALTQITASMNPFLMAGPDSQACQEP